MLFRHPKRQTLRPEQRQRIKVRVNAKDTARNITQQISARGFFQISAKESAGKNRQQEKQRITSRFLRIADVIRIHAQQRHGNDRCTPVKQNTSQPIDRWQSCDRQNYRQAANKKFRTAKMQPPPQQNVVQRHIAFPPPKQMQEVPPIQAGSHNAEALIKPERLAREKPEPQSRASREEYEEGQRF